MVSLDLDNTPVYALFGCYMAITFGIAIYGMFKRKKTEASGVDQLEAHFLGNKGFGVYVTSMNLIASMLTGHVVVGIPGDTASYGYFTMSYIAAVVTAISFQAFFWPRLGVLSRKRNWLSPNDFISDRFNSKTLRALSSFCGSSQLLFITAIEWMALGTMLNVLVGEDMNPNGAVWFLGAIVFICEMMGGMSSVALTDAVQASFLLLSFALMPILIAERFGGMDGFTNADCSNKKAVYTAWPDSPPAWGVFSTSKNIEGFQIVDGVNITFNGAYNQTLYGCLEYTAPWTLWTPPKQLTQLMGSVTCVFISWPIQPMAVHRVMVAKDGEAVRASILSFLLFPCLIFLPGIVMGLGVKSEYPATATADAFMTMCASMVNAGGFYAVVSVLFMTSSIAAFMSTSDSIVLAISNTLTVDLIKNWTLKNQSSTTYLYISKGVSLTVIVLGITIGLYSGLGLFDFVNIAQGSMNCVLAPYYVGMYWNGLSANACILGTIAGLITLYATEYGIYQQRAPTEIMGDIYFLSSFWCALVSTGTSIAFSLIFALVNPQINNDTTKVWFMKWDEIEPEIQQQYGKRRLDGPEMTRCTQYMTEPSNSWLGIVLFVFAAAGPFLSLPWGKDELVSEGVMGAFPLWAYKTFVTSMVSMLASAMLALFFHKPEEKWLKEKGLIAFPDGDSGTASDGSVQKGEKGSLVGPFATKTRPNQVVPGSHDTLVVEDFTTIPGAVNPALD